MINTFWKKITIFNIGVIIIILKIYDPVISHLNSQSQNDSIFPKTAENGYPFTDQINYNLQDIKQISHSLLEKNKNKIENIPINIPSKICSFGTQSNICKDNKKCFDSMKKNKNGNNKNYTYHRKIAKDEYLNNDKVIELFKEENQFNSKNNIIEKEFYHRLINGYSSYINILNNDINLIKEITHNENKLNDLFYLYSLFLYSYIKKDNITKDLAINKLMSYKEEELTAQINKITENEKKELKNILTINLFNNIINCLPDNDMRYSFTIDINSLLAMQSILFDKNLKQNKFFNFAFQRFNQAIYNIFVEDEKLRTNAYFYENYKNFFIAIYWIISLAFAFYCNRYFLKHKEFYGEKSRLGRNLNKSEKMKKYAKYQLNLKKIMQKQNRNKYTKEELEMIEKLTKKKDDYIISKN